MITGHWPAARGELLTRDSVSHRPTMTICEAEQGQAGPAPLHSHTPVFAPGAGRAGRRWSPLKIGKQKRTMMCKKSARCEGIWLLQTSSLEADSQSQQQDTSGPQGPPSLHLLGKASHREDSCPVSQARSGRRRPHRMVLTGARFSLLRPGTQAPASAGQLGVPALPLPSCAALPTSHSHPPGPLPTAAQSGPWV